MALLSSSRSLASYRFAVHTQVLVHHTIVPTRHGDAHFCLGYGKGVIIVSKSHRNYFINSLLDLKFMYNKGTPFLTMLKMESIWQLVMEPDYFEVQILQLQFSIFMNF